jgi:uncharacterized protein
MKIKRRLLAVLQQDLMSGKVIILYGPRQVGKTTLVKELIAPLANTKYFLCDEPDIRTALMNVTSTELRSLIGSATTIVIDEAQRVENIGLTLKLIHDVLPHITVIATGSSSFDLANKIMEPLTGRSITRTLYPISFQEYVDTMGVIEAKRLLGDRLRYGMYPAVITAMNPEDEIRRLGSDNLFKDVFKLEGVRKPLVLEQLASLLAFQMGSEVSYNEIAQKLQIGRTTVISYIRLLEQAYIIYRLPAFGKNKRNEITRFDKVYFYDVGIRNALIGAFGSLESRQDVGALFEAYFITEKRKNHEYSEKYIKQYFWRTHDGSEVDLVEEKSEKLEAFECKWGNSTQTSRAWLNQYPETQIQLVNRDTISGILLR